MINKTKILTLFLSLINGNPIPRQINDSGMSILARSESLRLDAYPDGKLWTIGWGTTRIGGKPVVDGMKITWSEANDLLNRDLRQFE